MKKILLFSLLALGTIANAQCDPINTFPTNYNFNNLTTPAIPACWTITKLGADSTDWNSYTGDGNNGTTSGVKYLNNFLGANASGDSWIFTQAFSLVGGQPYALQYTSQSTNNTNHRILKIAAGPNASPTGMVTMGQDASIHLTPETSAFVFTPSTTGNYYFGIEVSNTVTDEVFCSVLIRDVQVRKEQLAVSDVNGKSKITAYPNPVKDVMKLSDITGVKSISISDLSGRQIKTLAPSSEINLSNLKPGNYVVSLLMENGSTQSINTIKK
ncbi:MAG: hypothetical protein DI529_17515 [Chryseobacterium sp.]|nr:MAG: hypothetical protein DI529_17515 [Chryseobacterium sp.]